MKKKLIITAVCGFTLAFAWMLNPSPNIGQEPTQCPPVAPESALAKGDRDNTVPTASLPTVSEENA